MKNENNLDENETRKFHLKMNRIAKKIHERLDLAITDRQTDLSIVNHNELVKDLFEDYETSTKIMIEMYGPSKDKEFRKFSRELKVVERLKIIDEAVFEDGIINLPTRSRRLFRSKIDGIDDHMYLLGYYMSRYSHDDLFDVYVPASFCFEYLGKKLNKVPGTIRGVRDIFDALLTEEQKTHSRKGAAVRQVTEKFKKMKEVFDLKTEEEIKKDVIAIIAEVSG